MDFDRRIRLELTPNKSIVVEKGGYVKIKYINKIGEVRSREQCKSCKHRGKVQLGLGYSMAYSCDVDPKGWKLFSGVTDRNCSLYMEET